jgi:hypothetical protein
MFEKFFVKPLKCSFYPLHPQKNVPVPTKNLEGAWHVYLKRLFFKVYIRTTFLYFRNEKFNVFRRNFHTTQR